MAKSDEKKRKHTATYARDKKKGGYLVRVIGPNAAAFAGRNVPVFSFSSNEEHMEKLIRLIWTGNDEGFDDKPGTGLPAALYTFESKPREAKEVEF